MAKRNVIVSDLAKNYFPGRVCFNSEKMPIKVRGREICSFQMSVERCFFRLNPKGWATSSALQGEKSGSSSDENKTSIDRSGVMSLVYGLIAKLDSVICGRGRLPITGFLSNIMPSLSPSVTLVTAAPVLLSSSRG